MRAAPLHPPLPPAARLVPSRRNPPDLHAVRDPRHRRDTASRCRTPRRRQLVAPPLPPLVPKGTLDGPLRSNPPHLPPPRDPRPRLGPASRCPTPPRRPLITL